VLGSSRVPRGLVRMLESGLDNFILNLSRLLSALLTVSPTLSHPQARGGWLWCANRGAGKFGPQTYYLWL
jgi:hypothetical protein